MKVNGANIIFVCGRSRLKKDGLRRSQISRRGRCGNTGHLEVLKTKAIRIRSYRAIFGGRSSAFSRKGISPSWGGMLPSTQDSSIIDSNPSMLGLRKIACQTNNHSTSKDSAPRERVLWVRD